MRNFNFKLPDIGEGIAEAEIVAWHVAVGDDVEEDTPLVDLMTDKATVEITSPVTGRLSGRSGEVGDQIPIGATLATFVMDEAGADPATVPADTSSAAPAAVAAPAMPFEDAGAVSPVSPVTPTATDPACEKASETCTERRISASPAVRRRAETMGIDLRDVRPQDGGRVRHADLDHFLRYNSGSGYAVPGRKAEDQQIKVAGLRRRIADNMAASKRNIPHFTYIEEFDVTKLEALRADLNDSRGERPRLTILPLLITAICRTLPDFPMLNARYDDQQGVVTRSGAVHLGIATQTAAGLMVPVIRHAETLNIWQLAAKISQLADAARSGKAKSDDLSGSTLTITSLGALGGIATTPVINRPEVAIIGPNKVIERPIIRDGAIAIAKLMNLSISCDHRVVDGWDAASFVHNMKRLVETPALLFID